MVNVADTIPIFVLVMTTSVGGSTSGTHYKHMAGS